MSFNKWMHPRNPYKKHPPDFKALAIKYADLRRYCTLGLNGKMHIDFMEDNAVRELTKAIFDNDFNLSVEIPHGCLVPRIPQRLNYLFFIEDLLQKNDIDSDITGLDIGTGASCVYALLGVKKFNWKFYATDTDLLAISTAKKNVERNQLEDSIKVVTVSQGSIFKDLFSQFPDLQLTFCMCNPPFFHQDELTERFPARTARGEFSNIGPKGSISRDAPRSSTIARSNELEFDGGEESFVQKIIEESLIFSTNIRFFSTMLGKKSSLKKLRMKLKHKNIKSVSFTLSQGRTQRWVLVWSFLPNAILDISH